MNNIDKILSFYNQSSNISIVETLVNLMFCLGVSFIIQWVYKSYSRTKTNKSTVSRIIPLLTMVTFLVIVVVKSSLALSLGLVGALSIVRFRTPIKEPEELTFLFLSISTGLGYAASQTLITTLVVAIILAYVVFVYGRKTFFNDHSGGIFCYVEWTQDSNLYTNIINEAQKIFDGVDVQRFSNQDGKYFLTLNLKTKSNEQITTLMSKFANQIDNKNIKYDIFSHAENLSSI